MASTKYTYSISADFPNQVVNSEKLTLQIEDSSIPKTLESINTNGDDCDIWFADALTSGEETTLDGLVAVHDGSPVPDGPAEIKGGLILKPLDTPGAPVVSPVGTTGSTVWGYKIAAKNKLGETIASVETQISNGNVSLNSSDYNKITWDEIEHAEEYCVYRTTAGGTPSTLGKLAATINLELHDTGLSASGSEPSEDLSGALGIGGGLMAVSRLLHVRERTNDKETVTSIIHASRETPNVAEEGFGTGLLVSLQDATPTTPVMRSVGAVHVLWEDPDPSELKTSLRLMVRDGALPLKEAATFKAAGSEIDGVPYASKALELVERKVVTGSAVEEVIFSSLNGDVDRIYQLIALIKNGDTAARTFYLRPNDEGSTDTESNRVRWDGTTVDTASSTYLRIGSMNSGEWCMSDVLLYAKSGQPRFMRAIEAYELAGDGRGSVHCGVWEEESDNITSLVVKGSAVGSIGVGSEFSLYRVL